MNDKQKVLAWAMALDLADILDHYHYYLENMDRYVSSGGYVSNWLRQSVENEIRGRK